METLEKAKTIIQTKTFCFTEQQVQDAKERGDPVMEKEDTELLLSVELPKPKLLLHDMENYNSRSLFAALEQAKSEGLDGVIVFLSNITNEDVLKIEELGFFVEFIGPGDIGDEIFFTEDALIRNRVYDFKNLFADLSSVAYTL